MCVVALALAAWVAPRAAQAQAPAQLPPRVELRDVLADLVLFGVHIQPSDFVAHYAAYLDAVGESWLQVERQVASAPQPPSDSAERLVPSVKELQRTHQALTAAALQGQQMLDAFLDKLAACVPPDEADAYRAFRDQCQVSLANEASDAVLSQLDIRHPQEIGGWLLVSCNPLQLKEEQRAAIAAALMRRSAERSQAAQDLTRTLKESALAGARMAEKLGKSNESVRWYDVEESTSLSQQAWVRYAGLQWECWKDIRAHLPASVRRYMAQTFLTTLVQRPELFDNWDAELERELPIMVDRANYQGLEVIRTALAIPGLTEEQRKGLRQICTQWAEARVEMVESCVQAELKRQGDTKPADPFALDDEYRAKLAEIAAAPWLMGVRVMSDPAVSAAVPDHATLSLAPEDDAAFPLPKGLGSLDPSAEIMWKWWLGEAPESPAAGAKEQLLAALALEPNRESVVRLIWDDAEAEWQKNVAPRFQEYRRLQSKTDRHGRIRMRPANAEESKRRTDQANAIQAALTASWAAADAWHDALAVTLRASVPPEKEPIAAAFGLGLIADAGLPVSPFRDSGDVNPGRASLSLELSAAGRAIAVQDVARVQPQLVALVRAIRDGCQQDQSSGAQGGRAEGGGEGAARAAQAGYRREVAAVCAAVKDKLSADDAKIWALLQASDRRPFFLVWLTDASVQLDRVSAAQPDQQPVIQAARAALRKDAEALVVMNETMASIAARLPDWVIGSYRERTMSQDALRAQMRSLRSLAQDRRLLALIRLRSALPPDVAGQMSVLSKLSPVDALRRRAAP